MFGRSSTTARVCLRCQQRLIQPKTTYRFTETVLDRTSKRRWQSTESPAVATDESAPSMSGEIGAPSLTHTIPGPDRTFRNLRPENSTSLGIDSLGAPAEVLILRPRDKRIANRPVRSANFQSSPIKQNLRDRDDIQETTNGQSIDAELRPITWNDVRTNIQLLRQSWKPTSTLDAGDGQWQRLKSDLATGFTVKQLRKYLTESFQEIESGKDVDDRAIQKLNKEDLAEKLMSDVWKLDADIDPVQVPSEDERTFVKVNQVALDLALSDRSEPVRWVADKYAVQVDVFRATSEVEIIGPPIATQAAGNELRSLLKDPYTTKYLLDATVQKLLSSRSGDEYLKALMRRYNVRVHTPGTRLHVTSLSPEGLSLVERELTRISASSMQKVDHSFLLTKDSSDLSRVQTLLLDGQNWFHNQQTWYRHVKHNDTDAPFGSRQTEAAVSGLVNLLDDNGFCQLTPGNRLYDSDSRSVRQSFTAEIGQVIHNERNASDSSALSLITLDAARLPQLLASKHVAQNWNQSNAVFTYRLRPKKEHSNLPIFEVLMVGNSPQKGLKQPLQMRRVSAILSEKSHDVLIPEVGADVRLTSTITIDLFLIEKPALAQQHLRLLQTFADVIKQMQTEGDENMKLVWKIDCSNLLKQAQASETAGAADANSKTKSGLSSGVEENLQLEQLRRDFKTARYMLEAPEILDVFSTTTGLPDELWLRHIMRDAGPIERPRRRQTLLIEEKLVVGNAKVSKDRPGKKRTEGSSTRAIPESTTSTASTPKVRLERILNAAVGVARELGSDPSTTPAKVV